MTILYLCNFDLSPFFATVTDIRVRNPLVVEVLSVFIFILISIFERKRKKKLFLNMEYGHFEREVNRTNVRVFSLLDIFPEQKCV